MSSKRIEWIDNIKGLGIILIVWGHLYPTLWIKKWLYSFHLPLFFFISGYLRKKRSVKETAVSKAKSLLLPYMITAILSFPIGFVRDAVFNIETSLLERIGQLFYWNGSVGWNTPIWFLLVLFLVEVFYALIDELKVDNSLSIFIVWLLGLAFYILKIVLPFGLHIVCWMMPLYHLGVLVRERNLFDLVPAKWRWPSALFLIILGGLITFLMTDGIAEVYLGLLNHYIVYFINAAVVILGICLLSLGSKKLTFLQFFGRHSLFILCTHYLFLYFFQAVDRYIVGNKMFHYTLLPSVIMLLTTLLAYLLFFNLLKVVKKQIDRPGVSSQ